MCNFKDSPMKVTVIFIPLLLLASLFATGQRNLTKEEILQDNKTSHLKKRLSKDSIKLTWSDDINTNLRYRMDSLNKLGVDSLIVYSVSYPGYSYRLDSCTSQYGTSAYLIWKRQGKVTIEKFKGRCYSILDNDKSQAIFTFYDRHHSQLKDEFFMDIIYNGQTNDNNGITYTTSISFHEPKYSLYYDINSSYNSFTFGESELEDKKNIFYNYNLELAAYHWWTIITKQVKQ
jgi:hypothetical protein